MNEEPKVEANQQHFVQLQPTRNSLDIKTGDNHG